MFLADNFFILITILDFLDSRVLDFQAPPPEELSDPNLHPLPTYPGIKFVARSPCCNVTASNTEDKCPQQKQNGIPGMCKKKFWVICLDCVLLSKAYRNIPWAFALRRRPPWILDPGGLRAMSSWRKAL